MSSDPLPLSSTSIAFGTLSQSRSWPVSVPLISASFGLPSGHVVAASLWSVDIVATFAVTNFTRPARPAPLGLPVLSFARTPAVPAPVIFEALNQPPMFFRTPTLRVPFVWFFKPMIDFQFEPLLTTRSTATPRYLLVASVNCSVEFFTNVPGTPLMVNAPDASTLARYARPFFVRRRTLLAPCAVPLTVTPAAALVADMGIATPANATTLARTIERIFTEPPPVQGATAPREIRLIRPRGVLNRDC